MARVLHVAECYGGGVSRAIKSRVTALPEHDHYLLWAGTEPPSLQEGFAGANKMPDGFFQRLGAVRAEATRVKADLVHAHSSWAGVYSRTLRMSVPVVYEPHCFKFDDPELSSIARLVFWSAERLLARRTRAFGVLSSHEEALAKGLGTHLVTVQIPNTPTLPINNIDTNSQNLTKIVMIGRLSRQKDPAYFLEVVNELRLSKSELLPAWIGDGDQQYRQLLEDAGIRVTGWLEPNEITKELAGAVYLHTASYEGFPLSVLDAAAAGAPIVARRIPPLGGTSIIQGDSPNEVAQLLCSVSLPGPSQTKAFGINNGLLARYNPVQLANRLNILYEKCA